MCCASCTTRGNGHIEVFMSALKDSKDPSRMLKS